MLNFELFASVWYDIAVLEIVQIVWSVKVDLRFYITPQKIKVSKSGEQIGYSNGSRRPIHLRSKTMSKNSLAFPQKCVVPHLVGTKFVYWGYHHFRGLETKHCMSGI